VPSDTAGFQWSKMSTLMFKEAYWENKLGTQELFQNNKKTTSLFLKEIIWANRPKM